MLASRHKKSQDGHKHALVKTIKDNTFVKLKYQVGQARMLMISQTTKYTHKQKTKKTCSHAPNLLAMHHERLLEREHSLKKIIIDSTQKKKSSKYQQVKHLSACVKVLESTLCDYRICYGRVISPQTIDRTSDKC